MSWDTVSNEIGDADGAYVLVESFLVLLGDLPLLASDPLRQQATPKTRAPVSTRPAKDDQIHIPSFGLAHPLVYLRPMPAGAIRNHLGLFAVVAHLIARFAL
jgi:hypothetical protein